MTKPSDTITTATEPRTVATRWEATSIAGLMAVVVLTNVWFFSQVLTYT